MINSADAAIGIRSPCPQQGDLRLLGPPSGRGADGGARTRDRRIPADLRADSQATVPPTPPSPGANYQQLTSSKDFFQELPWVFLLHSSPL
ncbi:hypothetical protein PoB_004807900 [Plakobranchus ocellatus]|uniref:Uncharacterized protein n=1 Tax=Plakobranchus ocellatus TaxID=259542 RepID=A0AAV4BN67_9GAST|nr:hypothetical protein PoB_004807900 [Plakobranchus ocellatus]